jgi:hypothetical protein
MIPFRITRGMLISRSGNTSDSYTESTLTPTKNLWKKEAVNIDKTELIEILKAFQEIKAISTLKTLYGDSIEERKHLDGMYIKVALMKVGFVPYVDSSLEQFYEKLAFYRSDNEIMQYLTDFSIN